MSIKLKFLFSIALLCLFAIAANAQTPATLRVLNKYKVDTSIRYKTAPKSISNIQEANRLNESFDYAYLIWQTDSIKLSDSIAVQRAYTNYKFTQSKSAIDSVAALAAPLDTTTIYETIADTAAALRTTINTKGSGTVTQVNTGYGIVTTTITTTGTITADTGAMATRSRVQKAVDSLNVTIGTKGTVTAVNAGYAITGGNITTTGTHGVDSGLVATRLRVQKAVDSLNTVIGTKGNGSVTFINSGYGITTTTITTTGTITVDTFAMSTKANRLKGNDSVIAYVNTSITAERSATATLTNKRITYRVTSAANYSTSVTIDADNYDVFEDSLQAGALLFNAPSGTPTNYQLLEVAIRDNGTARALTYNAIFAASTDLSLPTTTTISKWLFMLFQYNSRTAKWYLIAKLDNL